MRFATSPRSRTTRRWTRCAGSRSSTSIIHRDFYARGQVHAARTEAGDARGLSLWGVYKDPVGVADVFEVVP